MIKRFFGIYCKNRNKSEFRDSRGANILCSSAGHGLDAHLFTVISGLRWTTWLRGGLVVGALDSHPGDPGSNLGVAHEN
jgi:hypothetical protein